MKDFLYDLMSFVSRVHEKILSLNDEYELYLSDKSLHFIVIGLLGLGLVFVIQPIFKALAKKGHVMVITWIYVFTLIIVITFSIEIGQKLTNTGIMDFYDTAFGIVGFLFVFLIFAIIRGIIKLIISLFNRSNEKL